MFARIYFLRKKLDVKNLGLVHGIPPLVNGRVIYPFCEGFIFAKLQNPEVSRKEKPCENF